MIVADVFHEVIVHERAMEVEGRSLVVVVVSCVVPSVVLSEDEVGFSELFP